MPWNKGHLVGDPVGDWSHGLRDLSAAGPDGLTTATEAEAPTLMFKKHMTNQPRFTKETNCHDDDRDQYCDLNYIL